MSWTGDEETSIIDRLARRGNPAMDEEASDMIVLAESILHQSRIDGALVEMENPADGSEPEIERDRR